MTTLWLSAAGDGFAAAADEIVVLDSNSLWRHFEVSRCAFARTPDGKLEPWVCLRNTQASYVSVFDPETGMYGRMKAPKPGTEDAKLLALAGEVERELADRK